MERECDCISNRKLCVHIEPWGREKGEGKERKGKNLQGGRPRKGWLEKSRQWRARADERVRSGKKARWFGRSSAPLPPWLDGFNLKLFPLDKNSSALLRARRQLCQPSPSPPPNHHEFPGNSDTCLPRFRRLCSARENKKKTAFHPCELQTNLIFYHTSNQPKVLS